MQQRWDGRGDRGRQGMATEGCFAGVSGLLPVPPSATSTSSTFSSVLRRHCPTTTIELLPLLLLYHNYHYCYYD